MHNKMNCKDYSHTGTIMQKIEELREWQRQQQDKLLQQQEEQRLLLNNEQQRMYEVFGLQNIDVLCERSASSKSAVPARFDNWHDSSSEKSPDNTQDSNSEEDRFSNNRLELPSTNVYVRETEEHNSPDRSLLLQPDMKDSSKKKLCLDETPVVSPTQDFHQLLQEKLDQYGGGDNNHNGSECKEHKPKRKFLRKGEGLARFIMKPTQLQSQQQGSGKCYTKGITVKNQPISRVTKSGRSGDKFKKSASLSVTGINRNDVKESQPRNGVGNNKIPRLGPSKTSKSQYPRSAVPRLTLKSRETSQSDATWANILLQQNQQDPKLQFYDCDSEVHQNSPAKEGILFLEKINDDDKKKKKEIQELKLFELLEQHAANSSFCSTSSFFVGLMEGSINSTPVKNNPFGSPHKCQNENLAASLLQSYSPKGLSNQEQMLSGSLHVHNKDTICGYLPYGLDNADNEHTTNRGLSNDDHKSGAYEKTRNPVSKLTIENSSQWELGGGQTSLNISNNSIRTNNDVSPPSNKQLHVRFAETNEYKSFSDGDTSFSSQDDTNRNNNDIDNNDSFALETANLEQSRDRKHFQDDQAWSDDCSCTSSEGSKSPNTSLNTADQSLSVLQSPKPSSQHQMVNNEYQVYSMVTNPNRFPVDSDKLSYSLSKNCANTRPHVGDQDHPHVGDQGQVQFGVTTQSKSNNEIVFKSALLRTRLEELEKEIDIFRKENTNLKKIQKKHEEDVSRFNKEKKELEKKMNEEKENMESLLLEERKKLNKEKCIFEKYCKNVRNQPTKQEREEIQSLKQQLADLQEEMHKKDSRWSATQVRTRDRLTQLEQENAQLKNEFEKLNKERTQTKMVKSSTRGRSRGVSTRMIHAVNDHIAKIKPNDMEDSIIVHDVVPTKKIPASVLQQQTNPSQRQAKAKQPSATRTNEWGNMCTKAYQTYINIPDLNPQPSTNELLKVQDDKSLPNIVINHRVTDNSSQSKISTIGNELISLHTTVSGVSYSSEEEDIEGNYRTSADDTEIHRAIYDAFYYASPISTRDAYPENRSDINSISKNIPSQPMQLLQNEENGGESTQVPDNRYEPSTINGVPEVNYNSDHFSRTDSEQENASNPLLAHESNTSSQQTFLSATQNSGMVSKPSANREKVYPDGRKEIWYPNGNLKKIAADGSLTKMIYYNGDVKETQCDGTIKYFYSETKTWHTTYTDGLEILEFPDGQLERRQKDGTKEVTYPNATVRTCFPDGREEWIFQDGLVVKVDSQLGERVLLLPNGQREVQTKEHMRREYPDGTVKIVYPDGVQETRYSNGRIRVKDKDGNLIMDSMMQRL